MNAKRQTIWLVSMLSLMVVLSVYYLFTEDSGQQNYAAELTDYTDDITVNLQETDPADDADAAMGAGAEEGNQPEANGDQAKGASTELTDEQILDQLASQETSADDFIAMEQMKRNEDIHKQAEKLMAIINDSKADSETVSKAYDDYVNLEQQEMKVNNIEETLLKDFRNAIVTEEENRWKVIVQSGTLDKSQADSIIQMVVKEMEVEPEKVVVQLLRQN